MGMHILPVVAGIFYQSITLSFVSQYRFASAADSFSDKYLS